MISVISEHWRLLWLMLASLLAGIMNAMAGGGSFLSFPAMMGVGMPPIEANATNTVAIWPGQLTSLATLRGDVRKSLLPVMLLASVVGGVGGAEVLLHTRQVTFMRLIPWLLLTGALIFGVSGRISKWLRARSEQAEEVHYIEPEIHPVALFASVIPVCFYIGYFGAGGGFLLMTVLALFGMEDMHRLNAMKVVVATASNFCAVVTFVVSGRILWHYCLLAMGFAAVGGYIGARYAKRMNPEVLRTVVVVTGVVIAGYFFWRNGA
jgi:uncharacterized membrane protein YfcA